MGKSGKNTSNDAGLDLVTEDLGGGCYAFSGPGFSTAGAIVGERGVVVIDTQADESRALEVLGAVRAITDKPVRYCVLTHFHCDRTLGALSFEPVEIIGSDLTKRMMISRGRDEAAFAAARTPDRVPETAAQSAMVPPSLAVASSLSLELGNLEVRIMHLGRGHTMGDTVVWVPSAGVLYAGDAVQHSFAPSCGDAHLSDWLRALDRIAAFRPSAIVPGYGPAAIGSSAAIGAVERTRDYIATLRDTAAACVEQGLGLRDTYAACAQTMGARFSALYEGDVQLPVNVARAYDEALGLDVPQIWTVERLADVRDALAGVEIPVQDAPAPGERLEVDAPQADAADDAEPSAEPARKETSGEGAGDQEIEASSETPDTESSDPQELVSDQSFEDALLADVVVNDETDIAGYPDNSAAPDPQGADGDAPVSEIGNGTGSKDPKSVDPDAAIDADKSLDEMAADYMREPDPGAGQKDGHVVKVLADAPS